MVAVMARKSGELTSPGPYSTEKNVSRRTLMESRKERP